MTQASHDSQHSLGAAAAAAVTGIHHGEAAAPHVTEAPAPADAPATNGEGAAAGATETTEAAPKKARNAKKIYVVVGDIYEFETAAKAEKFLNGDDAPATCTLLRGQRIKPRQKVTLR